MAERLDPVPAREPVLFREPLVLTPTWVRWFERLSLTTQQRLGAIEATLEAITPVLLTWTPTLVDSSGTSGHTYSVQWGQAIKTGNNYTIAATLALSALDPIMAGFVDVAGLPAAASGPPALLIPVSLAFGNVTLGGQFESLMGAMVAGEPRVRLYQQGRTTGWDRLPVTALTATTQIALSGSYWAG